MISTKLEKAINEQIRVEEESSRIYMAMASWCEVQGYPGAAQFLYAHSDEERMHQIKLFKFLNDRGGHARLEALETPSCDFNSLKEVFDEVMKHEVFVTKCINELYEVALNEKDYTTAQFLQWYIEEQIEEESLVNGILDKMKLAGGEKGGIFHIDKELESLATAEEAE